MDGGEVKSIEAVDAWPHDLGHDPMVLVPRRRVRPNPGVEHRDRSHCAWRWEKKEKKKTKMEKKKQTEVRNECSRDRSAFCRFVVTLSLFLAHGGGGDLPQRTCQVRFLLDKRVRDAVTTGAFARRERDRVVAIAVS